MEGLMTNEERSELFEAAVSYYMGGGEESIDFFPSWLIHVSIEDDSIEAEYEARRWLKAHDAAIEATMKKMNQVLRYAKQNTIFEDEDTQVAGVHYQESVTPMNGKHSGEDLDQVNWSAFTR